MELYSSVKNIAEDQKVHHILLVVGDEGLKRFNSWNLSADDRKTPSKVWEKYEAQLEPSENFRVCRLKLRYFRQGQDETLGEFINRCNLLLAMKCKFTTNELDERLLEQIVASTESHD